MNRRCSGTVTVASIRRSWWNGPPRQGRRIRRLDNCGGRDGSGHHAGAGFVGSSSRRSVALLPLADAKLAGAPRVGQARVRAGHRPYARCATTQWRFARSSQTNRWSEVGKPFTADHCGS